VLHSFTGSSDGKLLYDGLIRDAEGHLYGATLNGGSGGYGTVWKLTPEMRWRQCKQRSADLFERQRSVLGVEGPLWRIENGQR